MTEPMREIRHDERGQLDDVAIGPVDLVRIERMDTGAWWMRLTMPDGADYVFWFSSTRTITTTVEIEKRDP